MSSSHNIVRKNINNLSDYIVKIRTRRTPYLISKKIPVFLQDDPELATADNRQEWQSFCRHIDSKLPLLEAINKRLIATNVAFALFYAIILCTSVLHHYFRGCCRWRTVAFASMAGLWILIHFFLVFVMIGNELKKCKKNIQEICDDFTDIFDTNSHSVKIKYNQYNLLTFVRANVSVTLDNNVST